MTGATRDRILAEATNQLLDKGYPAFTMAGVRDRLGLSSGSMFHAFGSKAELAAAVYVAGMLDYQGAILNRITAADAPEQAVRSLIDGHLGWVEDHRHLARFLFATLPDEVARFAKPDLAPHNQTFFEALDHHYTDLLGTARPGGRSHYPLAHAVCIGPAQEYCRQWIRGTVEATPRTLSPVFQNAALAALATLASPH
ncbi:TetR/AcrR family transcriptional regulator [Nocardia sp. NPDC050710]|uniref:TetR/AcrR family transcriptional regulator n=1 Tax=Nocardia sp. NPDC050710 TaxID=3157220 RepID=UPI0033F26EA9